MSRPLSCIAVVLMFLVGCESEPQSYEECILKHMPGTNEKLAVFAIEDACATKYGASTSE